MACVNGTVIEFESQADCTAAIELGHRSKIKEDGGFGQISCANTDEAWAICVDINSLSAKLSGEDDSDW